MIYSTPEQVEAEQRERALDDLCDTIMDGSGFPKHGSRYDSIDMDTILRETDLARLSEIIRDAVFARGDLTDDVADIVREYLTDSKWHETRLQELRDDEREEAETAEADSKRRLADGR